MSPSDNNVDSTLSTQHADVYWNVKGYSLRMGVEWTTLQRPYLCWLDDLVARNNKIQYNCMSIKSSEHGKLKIGF